MIQALTTIATLVGWLVAIAAAAGIIETITRAAMWLARRRETE